MNLADEPLVEPAVIETLRRHDRATIHLLHAQFLVGVKLKDATERELIIAEEIYAMAAEIAAEITVRIEADKIELPEVPSEAA